MSEVEGGGAVLSRTKRVTPQAREARAPVTGPAKPREIATNHAQRVERVERPQADLQLTDLPRLLEQHIAIVRRLIDATSDKREAILSQERATLEQAVAKESELLEELAHAEAERTRWVKAWEEARRNAGISAFTAIPSETAASPADGSMPRLREILDALPEKVAKDVQSAADTLNELLLELEDRNRQNAGLLYHSLAYVQMMLSAVTGSDQRNNIYGPNQQSAKAKGKAILDWRA